MGLYYRHLTKEDRIVIRTLMQEGRSKIYSVNWLGLPGWYLNSRLLKRQSFGKFQLKLFDLLVPLLRLTEFIPLPGLSIFVVARKR